jgi:small multidrug resistance family-3 protein
MMTYVWYALAAFAEIGGCFAFWAWWRQGQSAFWLFPGLVSLAGFAWTLAQVDSPAAGRTYAAYGGIYILASLLWLWGVERTRPDRWDLLGVFICLIGSVLIVLGPRAR